MNIVFVWQIIQTIHIFLKGGIEFFNEMQSFGLYLMALTFE